jgi:hypothetical protein
LARELEPHEPPDTLPTPELNPLLNPLLGQHMGRWSEVYFTTPPEKREEAVLELLRELEAAGPTVHAGARPVACASCGRDNSPQQNFCGNCGAPLTGDGSTPRARTEGSHAVQPTTRATSPEPALPIADYAGSLRSFSPVARQRETRRAGWLRIVDNLIEPGSSRFYVGSALVLVMVALTYMAWRSAQVVSQISQPAPAAAVHRPAPAGADQSPVKPESPGPGAANANPAPPVAAPALSTSGAPTTPVRFDPVTRTSAPAPPTPSTAAPQTPALGTGGAEELAAAQGFLNGTDGHERNSATAAEWLWKAVAKQNADATLQLSELYLKGDGVEKNCDQARLLLDAAARKGLKDAAERLRQLPDFGCQ